MANNCEIDFPVAAWLPDATNGPSQGTIATYDRPYLAYDDSTKETARSACKRMPAAYTGSGTLKGAVQFMMATATSGTVDIELSIEAVTEADATDLDAGESFDAVNSGSETVPGTAGYFGEIVITLANKDSVAAGDYFRLKMARDATDGTHDTATGDCRVLGVTVFEEA